MLSKHTHTLARLTPTIIYKLHVEDDGQGIDINDCTSKSLECTAFHQSHDP